MQVSEQSNRRPNLFEAFRKARTAHIEEHPTKYGIVAVSEIPSPRKQKVISIPGIWGYPDPKQKAIRELSGDFWPIELGEPGSLVPNMQDQSRMDALAFIQVINERTEPGEAVIIACASFATLTGSLLAEMSHDPQDEKEEAHFVVDQLHIMTPAGIYKEEDRLDLAIRYIREISRNNKNSAKKHGAHILASTVGTFRQALRDIPAGKRRLESLLNHWGVTERLYKIADHGTLVAMLIAAHDSLFEAQKIQDRLTSGFIERYSQDTGEPGLIFSGPLQRKIRAELVPGGHDMDCLGQGSKYGRMIANSIKATNELHGRAVNAAD